MDIETVKSAYAAFARCVPTEVVDLEKKLRESESAIEALSAQRFNQ
jgi:hypothetical protein